MERAQREEATSSPTPTVYGFDAISTPTSERVRDVQWKQVQFPRRRKCRRFRVADATLPLTALPRAAASASLAFHNRRSLRDWEDLTLVRE